MTKFVVDANVAIKWVLTEIHSDAALRLRNSDSEILVLDFFYTKERLWNLLDNETEAAKGRLAASWLLKQWGELVRIKN